MMADSDRPQDVGRRHTRKRSGGSDDPILARYQTVLRAELVRLMDELEAHTAGLGGITMLAYDKLRDRAERIDLASKIARELGSAIDPQPAASFDSARSGRATPRSRRVAYD